jgi:hypothetical protein
MAGWSGVSTPPSASIDVLDTEPDVVMNPLPEVRIASDVAGPYNWCTSEVVENATEKPTERSTAAGTEPWRDSWTAWDWLVKVKVQLKMS